MSNSLYFKIKDNVAVDKHRFLEIFFKDWVDAICENKVRYNILKNPTIEWEHGMVHFKEVFRVEFENQEDALALALKGVPVEFQQYLEIIN